MADDKLPLTRSRVWTMPKAALENELSDRNIPFSAGATREQLRKILRNVLDQTLNNDSRQVTEENPTGGPSENRDSSEHDSQTSHDEIEIAPSVRSIHDGNRNRRSSSRESSRTIDLRNRIPTNENPANNTRGNENNASTTRGLTRNEVQKRIDNVRITRRGTPRCNTDTERYRNRGLGDHYDCPDRQRDTLAERVRKWGVSFDGTRDLLDFLEQVEELSFTYEVPLDNLISCLPILLKGKAIAWYRNNRRNWCFWEDFKYDIKQFFLPVNIDRQLEEDIRNRTQGPKECAHDFITALQTLIRRYGGMRHDNEVERLYRNLRPEY